ncbi:MAG: hypothetical protein K8R34_04715, partial [Methanosarcinales archaeon]|nr:hypothetical protein [Methanosarcinales archaeon]
CVYVCGLKVKSIGNCLGQGWLKIILRKRTGASRDISVIFGFNKYQPQRSQRPQRMVKMVCTLRVLGGSKFTRIHKVDCHLPP